MGLNPIKASENIVEKYLRYIETTFYIDDKDYMRQFKQFLAKANYFAKGPYLDFSDSFEFGKSIKNLIDEGVLSKEFLKLYKSKPKILSRLLYKHQELSIRKVIMNKNVVVTTGTGSGKTESFLLPVINYLMKQKEKDELTDGVRALIIYPMNALANDQMKRMRELLVDYPDITFGSYTGETEKYDRGALSKYMSLNNEQKPIKNERISRNQMKKNPPHILITNYAMLEYLLLRPDDNVFFHGVNSTEWKYIVLDEAHTYTGATGIEVSMLLRRLKNILKSREEIRFILTSATLGDEKDNKEICDFASRLCTDVPFDKNSIVRAFRYSNFDYDGSKEYPSEIYMKLNTLIEEGASLNKFVSLIKKYDSEFSSQAKSVSEFLYDFLIQDRFYYKTRKILRGEPATIKKITNQLSVDENELVAFVSVARKAEKNNIMLLDARYHMFIRALEGAYVVLGSHKELSISPRDKAYINGQEFKSYKISVCQYCGQIYIEAKINKDSYLIQKKENEHNGINDFYMLLGNEDYERFIDDDNIMEKYEDSIYQLCGKCGKIEKANSINGSMCDCGKEYIVKVIESVPKNKVLNKCLACGLINRRGTILRGFYIGQEAAASVLGSSLYEEIPSEEVKVIETPHEFDDDFFGESSKGNFMVKDIIKDKVGKQLLVFSDSRQEAAYFSSYFDFTYNNILRRRLFIEALKEIGRYSDEDGIEITAAVKNLAALFEQHQIVEPDSSVKEAWKTILYEISSNDRNSLENLGLISFEYQGQDFSKLGLYTGDEVKVIQRVLANSFKRDCMFEFPLSKQMLKVDKEYYSYKGNELTMSLTKCDSKNIYCKSWIPSRNSNARFNYIKKTLNCLDKKDINKYLDNIWKGIFLKNKSLVAQSPDQYIMDISKFKIRASFVHDINWYICEKCGKVTVNNIKDVCPANRCDGKLKLCDFEKDFADNHYRRQYLEMNIFPMKVKEHTAQLSPETAKLYQEMFIKNEINVLSCSTTFEMGVDVGELETVFMKNMPPTPANYAQRAGRAGRRKNSVAFSLTFCRLSSHDLTYFNTPIRMIKGKIYPPKFKTENEKIVKRHMNASIIAAYWRTNVDAYKDVGTFFDEEIYNGLLDYIDHLSNDIINYIKVFVPLNLKGKIEKWISELRADNGLLNKAFIQYKSELEELRTLKKEALFKANSGESMGRYIKKIDDYVKKIKHENILSFLSKKNIIPKYGFPVDTVELVTSFDKNSINTSYGKSSKLRLQRDLMIAISEYAPASEVIADGNIYKSQFIKRPTGQNKVWDLFDFGICSNKKCGHLNIERHIDEERSKFPKPCDICGEIVFKKNSFIVPEYGFIISPKINKSTTKKPKRTYRGEIYYIGDKEEILEKESKEVIINNHRIKVMSTSNDELVVINNSNFYVCATCGFTIVDEKQDVSFIPNKKGHNNPYGKLCQGKKLYRRTLGHKFKTDVARISLSGYYEKERALSILYSLLEGVSQYLGIERNDISGTLHYNRLDSGVWETNFILFDTVPGGAGHVRRIGEADNIKLINMFKKSLDIVKQCNCGKDSNGDSACYSCLCNYYNQKHHDIIKRKYAIEFFEGLLNI
ncbi:DEAD/DEAH box helicase [Maledivibacter halophilus]|uniref:Distinct helicase family with a unique C-terminal domain including a metal-binding cysteine cluster n=1 Tax=Maledivibacter halophilus TaxID=36842 RepID=A0A1T5LV33_9FIRM|nr:DEAD/DEAH box helicase [Maledivibacter halophilus]SKC79887.1 Distinct helicase family with a unique C-terminal domain including a metal-binding cysteine cluster [Maledivibacter halophilus]